jgi:site-specific DNA-methyltransferase (adenine-specific)
MSKMIRQITQAETSSITSESQDAVVISTGFDYSRKVSCRPVEGRLTEKSTALLQDCIRGLKTGGLLFVYGIPSELPIWARHLMSKGDAEHEMIFKHWIALDIKEPANDDLLQSTHLGLMLFYKSETGKSKPTRFWVDADSVRVPHANCKACGLNLKDWGGKKHLMNPRGIAISDVWRDLPRRRVTSNTIPDDVLQRIELLCGGAGKSVAHVVQKGRGIEDEILDLDFRSAVENHSSTQSTNPWRELIWLEENHVYAGDCVSFLQRLKLLRPEGSFDLAFADPPYNLEKKYDNYEDALADQKYLEWCEAWLDGMAENLKPGGSLFALNLPKWAMHHATFLSRKLQFRHWIAWDALSDPRGKIMPAHYALLWFTKPGGKPTCNYSPVGTRARRGFVMPPDSPKYCLRASCIKKRKAAGDEDKVELTDVWFDIHRIKHKRDRDAHPCQLPEKLMDRIIKLASKPGDLIFDPFCGAGTTAIAATKLGRKFVVTELDANYVRITNEKLAAMKENAGTNGALIVPRNSIKRPRAAGSKKEIEVYLQNLARKLSRVPTESDVQSDCPEVLGLIDQTYSTRSAAFKRCKVALASSAR